MEKKSITTDLLLPLDLADIDSYEYILVDSLMLGLRRFGL